MPRLVWITTAGFFIATGLCEAQVPACVPGQQTVCACPADQSGVQLCAEDGRRYLPCECTTAPSQSQPRKALPFKEGPTPQGYVVDTYTWPGMWVPALIGFTIAYAVGAHSYFVDEYTGIWPQVIPLAGSFITLGTYETPTCEADERPDECSGGNYLDVTLMLGMLQLGGAIFMAIGLAPRKRFLRSDLAQPVDSGTRVLSSFMIVPQVTSSHRGVALRMAL